MSFVASNAVNCLSSLSSSFECVALPDLYSSFPGVQVYLPVYSSIKFQELKKYDKLDRAVVYIHGLERDADTYFCDGLAATSASGYLDSTLVLAPYFPAAPLNSTNWNVTQCSGAFKQDSVSASWSTSEWMSGGDSSSNVIALDGYTTSFDAMDVLIQLLLNNTTTTIKKVSVVGFSAGAQLTSRYAFLSRSPYLSSPLPSSPAPSPSSAAAAAAVRFFVGNPSSYLYPSPLRPSSLCRTPSSSSSSPTSPICPPSQYSLPSSSSCTTYDDYKYGVTSSSLSKYSQYTSSVNVTLQIEEYVRRDVRYMLGDEDVCNCNTKAYANNVTLCVHPELTCTPDKTGGPGCCDTYPDASTSNALDVTCGAMLQGTNRLQRGINFIGFLSLFYNVSSGSSFIPVYSFFHGGHDNAALYADSTFQRWAFTDSDTDTEPILTDHNDDDDVSVWG